jgi:pimeloyl-ACP methyl ester carboxylesterase
MGIMLRAALALVPMALLACHGPPQKARPDVAALRPKGPPSSTDLVFESGGVKLYGTLITPPGPGLHPAVVVVHGSGANTRENWRDQTEHFPEAGVALFRFDKRGSGASKGDWTAASMSDLANDVIAAVRVVGNQPEIDRAQIGVWGGSQGWFVAGLAAAMSREIAFAVLVSGFPELLWNQDTYAQRLRMVQDGRSPEQIKAFVEMRERMRGVLASGEGYPKVREELSKLEHRVILPYLFAGGAVPPEDHPAVRFWRLNAKFDARDHLKKIQCPVLSIWGAKDHLVDASEAQKIASEALRGHKDATVRVLRNADHGLYLRTAPGPGRAPRATRKLVPEYGPLVTGWVRERAGLD